jgi:nitrogen-specific signal transduction histidine kinase
LNKLLEVAVKSPDSGLCGTLQVLNRHAVDRSSYQVCQIIGLSGDRLIIMAMLGISKFLSREQNLSFIL